MPNILDLSGLKFGRLTALRRVGNDRFKVVWECLCDCGSITTARTGDLKSGKKKSCGCLRVDNATKHGKRWSGTYYSWLSMNNRCKNSSNQRYKDYGGRGILVCDRWKDFKEFYADMGDRPDGMTLDRIDVNKGYYPENTRWATRTEQSNNTRVNTHISYNGYTKSVSQWAREIGIPVPTVYSRYRKGWPVELVLSKEKYISYKR